MTMTLDRFRSLAAAYGGDIARWPPALRDEGRSLLAADPQAAEILAAERGVDALLDQAVPRIEEERTQELIARTLRATDPRLAGRLPARPSRQADRARPRPWAVIPRLGDLARHLVPAACLATAAAMGIAIGLESGLRFEASPMREAVFALLIEGTPAFAGGLVR